MFINENRLEEALARSRFDALVATTPENVQYAAGYESERLHNFVALQSYAVLTSRKEGATLILPSTEMVHLSSAEASPARLQRYGSFFVMSEPGAELTREEARLEHLLEAVPSSAGPVEALATELLELGLRKARIGLDENNFSFARFAELTALLPEATIEPAGKWFSFVRMVKSAAEIDLLRRAAAINEHALRASLAEIRAGVAEDRAEIAFRTATAQSGATPRLWGTSSGQNSSCFFRPGSRELRAGDLVRIDCGGTYKGYWSDTGITASCGPPRPEHARVYDSLKLAIEAGIEAARPGAPISAVAEAVMATASRSGLSDLKRHHCGHGIGRELYEPPMLVRAKSRSDIFAGGFEDETLEENMVLNIEAPYYRLGFGGLHLEHTILVKASGPEVLTGSRELHVAV